MAADDLLSRILTFGKGRRFFRLANADGKVWFMPVHNMRVGMNLYQPSSRKGKLLKAFFPGLYRFSVIRRIVHAESLCCVMNPALEKLMSDVFRTGSPEFSLFCGTPCVHQKITMQISQGKRISGYCKLTDREGIYALFRKESILLDILHRKGVDGIPKSLFCGKLQDGVWMFVQSSAKTGKSKTLHRWTALHEDFISRLYRLTHCSVLFEESDYCQTLCDLKEHLDWLPDADSKRRVAEELNVVESMYSGQVCDFSAYHADFTPWNMFVGQGKLFVFDWEYARLTYPPYLDRYHFFTQTAIFGRHWSADDIFSYMRGVEGGWMTPDMYRLYLLDVISRSTLREQGNFCGDEARVMTVWFSLLDKISGTI